MTRPKRSATIEPAYGSEFREVIPFKNPDGTPVNLFGIEVVVDDVSPELVGSLTVTVIDVLNGLVEIRILRNLDLVTKKTYQFRLWLKPGEKHETSLLIGVVYR